MKINIIYSILFVATLFVASSCKKDDDNPKLNPNPEPTKTYGSMVLKLDHTFAGKDLVLNTDQEYITSNSDTLTFSKFLYYLSNIKLRKTDGTIWEQPESYHLIDVSKAQNGICSVTLDSIPTGDYSEITFTVGVDSLRNVSGAQSGALDPVNGMFWSWKTGYIFLKAEGNYKNVKSGKFMYHIGGFNNSNSTNALQTKTLSFGVLPATVNPKANPQIHFDAKVENMFSGPGGNIQISATPTQMKTGEASINVSKNYIEMFDVDHIHN